MNESDSEESEPIVYSDEELQPSDTDTSDTESLHGCFHSHPVAFTPPDGINGVVKLKTISGDIFHYRLVKDRYDRIINLIDYLETVLPDSAKNSKIVLVCEEKTLSDSKWENYYKKRFPKRVFKNQLEHFPHYDEYVTSYIPKNVNEICFSVIITSWYYDK